MSAGLPRVDYLALGGTIASVVPEGAAGAVPTLTAADLVASVDGLLDVADVRAVQFRQTSSGSLTFSDLLELVAEIERRVADGAAGIVITQGTDAIEEVAFAVDLLYAGEAPVVVSGAMRNPSLPGADGPANVLGAVQVAISPAARGLGALVVLADEIHAARFVKKSHASSVTAFRSPATGPIGWLSEGRPFIATRPVGRSTLHVAADAEVPPVALVRLTLGDDGRVLDALEGLGYRGAVIEAFGGGHVAPVTVERIERLVAAMPVAYVTRTGAGEALAETYRFHGSEIHLLELGLLRAGGLDGLKARLVLAFALAAGHRGPGLADALQRHAQTAGAVAGPPGA
ncbi:asparaginase [Baekduia soli]|uniref:Asparaginase n=1 Tax=Baekduia soli TaxID=496014 RepID=A0A5B8U0P2_9ACTN|nr:asparaginase [Baekduia soli]QEC46522.1 asparaginase [Baekduia soli]